MKRALVIAPQPFFTPRGTPFSVYYRTLITSELGVKIDLLTYGEGRDVRIPGVRIIRIPRFKILGNVKIGPSMLKLFLDFFIFIRTVGLLTTNRYDFVHAHEESVFFCRFLKPVFRFKLIYDMHSSLPQQLTNFKFTTSRMLIGIFKKLEDSCLNAADAVITICPDLAHYASNIIDDKDKHLLIENSIFEPVKLEGENFGTEDEQSIQLPRNKKIVVYAGTLEPYQGMDLLVRSFKSVLKNEKNAFLLIIGGTPEQVATYENMAAEDGMEDDVLFTGRLSQQQTRQLCSQAAVQLSPRSSGTNTPLKVYEQLANGIPLVATNIYSHTQVLSEDVAILVEPNPHDLAEGILEAMGPRGQEVTRQALQLYNQKYSRPVYVEKMKNILDKVSIKCAAFAEY